MASRASTTSLSGALTRLETRWGSAAVTIGALALAPRPQTERDATAVPPSVPGSAPGQPAPASADEVLAGGFADLDRLLGAGGMPRAAAASLHGAGSSGKTTLALHWLAQAQAHGAIAAYLDLGRCFDPLEAAARGVDLRWLLVIRPADPEEGFGLAAGLLAGGAIDLLIADLPERLAARHEASLRRLAAHARRVSARLIVLEPQALDAALHGALAESVGLRLELEQRAWLRLGRDVVGRRIGVNVAKNRFGPPGRSTELDIHYLADGELAPAIIRRAAPAATADATARLA